MPGYGAVMPDAIYEAPRLAALYDTFDGERDDFAAYLHLARELDAFDFVDLGVAPARWRCS